AWHAGGWRTPRNRPGPRCGTWRRRASSQRAQPERQRLGAFGGFTYLLPRQVHRHPGLARVATARPESIVAARTLGAARIAGVAINGGEAGPFESPQFPRMRLARVEEAMAQAAAAILGQDHGLGAIEHAGGIDATLAEGRLERVLFVVQRQGGRGADHAVAIEGQDAHAVRRVDVG